MPTHSRGPPAPFPIAGQVPVPIQQPPAHRPRGRTGGSRDGSAFLVPAQQALNSISTSRK